MKLAVVGVPKTIDNDILLMDKTFGFDTAVEEAQRAINTAYIEVSSGWIQSSRALSVWTLWKHLAKEITSEIWLGCFWHCSGQQCLQRHWNCETHGQTEWIHRYARVSCKWSSWRVLDSWGNCFPTILDNCMVDLTPPPSVLTNYNESEESFRTKPNDAAPVWAVTPRMYNIL